MFLSEKALAIPVGERDFYTAHEVLQMVPIRAHKTTYKTFLTQNSWTKHYLPNAWDFNNRILRQFTDNRKLPVWRHVCSFMLALADPAAKAIQEFYMRKRRTSEIVTATMLRFHPRDARVWIKQKLQKRLDKFGIPLDKIFYAR